MDPQWLLTESPWLRLLALAGFLMPAVFIISSRRSGWVGKILWTACTLLPWAFVWAYLSVWRMRYGEPGAVPPVADAMGWWMLAFPWAVYLLYRATRRWYPGEPRERRGGP